MNKILIIIASLVSLPILTGCQNKIIKQPVTNNINQEITNLNVNNNLDIINRNLLKEKLQTQLTFFEQILEEGANQAAIECMVLANYNWVVATDRLSEPGIGFSEPAETYKNNCILKYLKTIQYKDKLIAEPELVKVRVKLMEFINLVEEVAKYAIDGGYSPSTIDTYDSKLELLLIETREEIIKAKRDLGL